jgi:hypothetical protein
MFLHLQLCMDDMTGILATKETLSDGSQTMTYPMIHEGFHAKVKLKHAVDRQYVNATMKAASPAKLGPVDGQIVLADGVTSVPYTRLAHADARFVTLSFIFHANTPITRPREVLSQLLWAVYPGALEWVE